MRSGLACGCLALVAAACTSTDRATDQTLAARTAVERYVIDVWVKRDTSALNKALAPSMVYHYNGKTIPGAPAAHFAALRSLRRRLPRPFGLHRCVPDLGRYRRGRDHVDRDAYGRALQASGLRHQSQLGRKLRVSTRAGSHRRTLGGVGRRGGLRCARDRCHLVLVTAAAQPESLGLPCARSTDEPNG
jgi:hypothetical protein